MPLVLIPHLFRLPARRLGARISLGLAALCAISTHLGDALGRAETGAGRFEADAGWLSASNSC